MVECENCLHSEVCDQSSRQMWSVMAGETKCSDFKDRTKWVEQKHGRWEPRNDVIGFVRCSVCHDCNIYDDWADGKKWNYCPNCGADMRERTDGE